VFVGCKDPYGASVKAGNVIAASVTAGLQTVASLQQSGTITTQEAISVAGYIDFVNKGDEAFLTCAASAHAAPKTPGAYTACATTFAGVVNNPQNLLLIKVSNPSAQGTISTIANGFATAVTAISTSLGGA
jgi:hypothetical protein